MVLLRRKHQLSEMQPVVDPTCPTMDRIYNIMLIALLAIMMIYVLSCIEQPMISRYYKPWEENFISLRPEWIHLFEESIQVAYSKSNRYTPQDWRKYNEGKDVGYNDGYKQGLTEGHDDGWDEAKEYYQKIFEREPQEAKESWQRTFDEVGSLPFEDMNEEFNDELPPNEWEDYKKDSEWRGNIR